MKKTFSLLLVFVLALGLCSCKNKKAEVVDETPVGTYKTIGIYSDTEYTLREDLIFIATDATGGTYLLNTDGSIWFSRGNELGFNFVKKGNYYYKSGEGTQACFSADTTENFNQVMFNENGRSNQSFVQDEGTKYYYLDLKEDGTYYAAIELYEDKGEAYELLSKKEFSGTYEFKEEILWLKHGGKKYPMIYDGGYLHYHVIEKVK